ncbi:DUF2637 domain-containing protein [Actinoallomurus purpureus]|uniref:DUF2637 domain-containing protein n=1 Tax=Actinoallomurus purpureus TaxID=478114 RepID=UPI002091F74D|nr:DUF2637 domain-containing protein [Actinoallomurus purpureus]MCO6008151.1 DUF2637 domain-containing protein [Actinoallomurus purpureus]
MVSGDLEAQVTGSEERRGDQVIRWATTLSVVVLAVIAAIVSYRHMYLLVRRYEETSWTAVLLPISVDGMIVTSSMSLLMDSRCHRRSGLLPWALLLIGSAASLAANVAVAEPSAVGRLIAAWPSCALIGSYELLMRQVRQAALRTVPEASEVSHTSPMTDGTAPSAHAYEAAAVPAGASYVAQTDPADDDIVSYEPHTNGDDLTTTSFNLQTEHPNHIDAKRLGAKTSGVLAESSESAERTQGRGEAAGWGLQRRAWQWAVAEQEQTGDLPTGKAIAEHFGRRERWGRLVKQAGLGGRFDRIPDDGPAFRAV